MIFENKKIIKYGMVGGGPGGFIADIHRKAAALDGEIKLVAGAFSSKPEKSSEMGRMLCLKQERVYGSYEEMAQKEVELPDNERLDFISIVTPNYLHFPVAKEFITRRFNILCDKPLVTNIDEANELIKLVKKNNVLFAVSYNYTGYPMAKQARELVKKGVPTELDDVKNISPEVNNSSDKSKNQDYKDIGDAKYAIEKLKEEIAQLKKEQT